MTKVLSFYCLIVLLVTQVSQSESSELIHELHNKYQDVSHYQASFIQEKKVSFISKTLITEGQLEFALDEGLIWQVEKPLWVKTLITKEGVFKTTKYQSKQKVKDLQIKLIAEIMTELLTANLDKIESHFSISPLRNDEDKTDIWQLDLIPKKIMLKKALKHIALIGYKREINDEENTQISGISEIVITDKSDNITRIMLNDIQLHKGPLKKEVRMKFE